MSILDKAKVNKIHHSSLVNIDSSFRNIYPKHIVRSDTSLLPNNPLKLTLNSTILTVNHPNHNLTEGDNIVMQNVESIIKIIAESFYLINNFKYLVINFNNNNIEPNYKDYLDELYINIETYGNILEKNIINNLPFNYLLGVKKMLIANDIPLNYLERIKNFSEDIFGIYDINILNKHCIFIELPIEFLNKTSEYYKLEQVFKLTYLHFGGIKLGYFNANYPINNYNYQNNHQIYRVIDKDYYQINLLFCPYGTIIGGGNKIQVFKIINSIVGYPDADNYTINLKKSFNNVIKIELISTEFPYVDIIVKKNINDKLYWKNIEDGDYIYSVQIDEGFYTASSIIDKIKTKINLVERITSTQINRIYNNFDITLESNIHKITFNTYNLTRLPNSISVRIVNVDSVLYYILNVEHPNNIVDINDTITISSVTEVTTKDTVNNQTQILLIDGAYFNKDHKVYSVNYENQTYDIILGKKSEIKITVVNYESGGGENIIVKSKTKVSFLFNKSDTLGDILGFKNVGEKYSITDYKSEITNQDSYINSINLNSVGNEIIYPNGFLNLAGKYNYFLMYLNDIECIYSNNNLPSAFAKILLSGNAGDILFNTFVIQPNNIYSKNFPISTLTELNISFFYGDGNRVNFRNINHSFTLKITEEITQNDNTYLNSQNISVIDEFKKANLKD